MTDASNLHMDKQGYRPILIYPADFTDLRANNQSVHCLLRVWTYRSVYGSAGLYTRTSGAEIQVDNIRPAKSHASRVSLTHFRPLKYYLTHFILSQLRVNFVRHVVVTRIDCQKNS